MMNTESGRAPLRVPVTDKSSETVKSRFRGKLNALFQAQTLAPVNCFLLIMRHVNQLRQATDMYSDSYLSFVIRCCFFIIAPFVSE